MGTIMKKFEVRQIISDNYHKGWIIANLDSHDPFVKFIFRFQHPLCAFGVVLKNRDTGAELRVDVGRVGEACGYKFKEEEQGDAQIEICASTQSSGCETDELIKYFLTLSETLIELLKEANHGIYELVHEDDEGSEWKRIKVWEKGEKNET